MKRDFEQSIVVIGPPASGKSFQSRRLAEYLERPLLLGSQILPETAGQYAPNRKLIPDELFVPKLEIAIGFWGVGPVEPTIFDNIPRTRKQAFLIALWARKFNMQVDTLELFLPEDEVRQRFHERVQCIDCGRTYHSLLNPPKTPEICDYDGKGFKPKDGDLEELVRPAYERHMDTVESIRPLLSNLGTFQRISAMGTVDETSQRIMEIIKVGVAS